MPVYSTRYNLLHEQETFIVPLDESNDFEGDVKEVKILVTGFGPWGPHATNPSSEIVNLLPESITIDLPIQASQREKANPQLQYQGIPTEETDLTDKFDRLDVKSKKLIVHIVKIIMPVSYEYTTSTLPTEIEKIRPDYILHVGLYSGRKFYSIDLSAPFEKFGHKDINGQIGLPVVPSPPLLKSSGVFKVGTAYRIQTLLDHSKIVKTWQKTVNSLNLSELDGEDGHQVIKEVRGTDDVGDFLCGYTYLHSLLRMKSRKALFCHIPDCPTEKDLDVGKVIIECLIKSMVLS